MRLFEALAVAFIATCQFLSALADVVETPPNTALEPLAISARQTTIPGLLVGGIGRRQIGDYCGGRTYCRVGYKCCSNGTGCCAISQNCVRDYLGNPGCCPIGIRCGGPAPDPITYTWTSRTTSTYTYTRTTSTYTSSRTWSTSSTFFTTLETSDVITNTPEPTIFSATTSSPLTSSSSTSRTSSTTTATQPAQTPTGGPIIVSGASKRVEGGVIFALWTTAILLLI